MIACRTALLTLFALRLSFCADQTFTIRGVVVRHDTNRPVAHALVTVQANDQPDKWAELKTAQDGQFSFTGVPRGKYTLGVTYRGFSQTFRQDGDYSTGIATGAGIDSEHIVFPLVMPGSLSVNLVDEEGEPIREVEPTLFRREVENGWALVAVQRSAQLYVNGTHKFSRLKPGVYLVGVEGRPWFAQDQQFSPAGAEQNTGGEELDVVYPTTYYPNTTSPEEARTITIREGEDRRIQMTVRAVPALHIDLRGPGFDRDPASDSPMNMQTNVLSVGPGDARFDSSTTLMMTDHLRVNGLSPGRHILNVSRIREAASQSDTLQSAELNLTGDTTLSSADLSPTGVRGRITIEGSASPSKLLVIMRDLRTRFGMGAEVNKDGSFTLEEPFGPGRYQLLLQNSDGYFVKSIVATGALYEKGLLQIKGGKTAQLTVTVAKGAIKEVDGVALAGGQAKPGAMVLLVPDDPNYGEEYPRDQSDSDGTFALRNIRPGKYRLVAVDNGRDLEYRNEAVMRPYLKGAQEIEFPAGSDSRLSVEVQKRQQ